MDDLVIKDNLFYKKFSDDVPFTGMVTGSAQGMMKKGLPEGSWIYYENGQLIEKQNFKNGILDGPNVIYYLTGNFMEKRGYKDGNPHGLWETYNENGKLMEKGTYKDGQPDGLFEIFNEDGSLQRTETWIDGVKQ